MDKIEEFYEGRGEIEKLYGDVHVKDDVGDEDIQTDG